MPVSPKPINTFAITIMLTFTFFLLFFSGFLRFPTVSTSFPPSVRPVTPTSAMPFTDLVRAFRKWDSQVGCARFKDKPYGVHLNLSKVASLQQIGHCEGLKLNHVSVFVKGWTWIPDNLDNLYSCSCGLSCLWTKSPVLADTPDALLFESSTPPVQGFITT